jgi:hypothetical protein
VVRVFLVVRVVVAAGDSADLVGALRDAVRLPLGLVYLATLLPFVRMEIRTLDAAQSSVWVLPMCLLWEDLLARTW